VTGELRVHVETGATHDAVGAVVTTLVGNVYAMTPGNPSLRHVRLPLGPNVEPATFDLPAGAYTVEASLPSGQILTGDVEIADNAPATVALDLTESSPYESHTLQYVVGNIEPKEVFESQETYPVPKSQGSRSFGRRTGSGDDSGVREPQAEVRALWRTENRTLPIEALVGLRELVPSDAARQVAELLGPSVQRSLLNPFYPRFPSPIYRFDEDTLESLPPGYWPSQSCQYLTVAAAGDAYLVTVPWPWPGRRPGTVAVDVMVNQRQSPTGSPVSVVVNDPAVSGALGYLSSGSLAKAAVLFADVEQMLYEKIRNPIAAAAGGYVLIGTNTETERQRWDQWLGNLRHWFPTLSDGAVLWGARRLRAAREQRHVDEAREALLEGFGRGLPVFTLGLTWLIEGLSAFPDDPECAAALRQVTELCWQVDMREPFVVLRLGRS
jgi:hypothetical protein